MPSMDYQAEGTEIISAGKEFQGKANEFEEVISSFRTNIQGLRGAWNDDAARLLADLSEEFVNKVLQPLYDKLNTLGSNISVSGQQQLDDEAGRTDSVKINLG